VKDDLKLASPRSMRRAYLWILSRTFAALDVPVSASSAYR